MIDDENDWGFFVDLDTPKHNSKRNIKKMNYHKIIVKYNISSQENKKIYDKYPVKKLMFRLGTMISCITITSILAILKLI